MAVMDLVVVSGGNPSIDEDHEDCDNRDGGENDGVWNDGILEEIAVKRKE